MLLGPQWKVKELVANPVFQKTAKELIVALLYLTSVTVDGKLAVVIR
jgi:hypothetical protein